MPQPIRRTRVEIDLDAILHNARSIRAHVGVPLWAVVKADGYGHGAVAVAQALAHSPDVHGFAVSLIEEGVALREAGVAAPILVMGPSLVGGEAEVAQFSLTPVVSDEAELERFSALAARLARRLDIHLKLDTGMARLGILPERAAACAQRADAGGLRVVGLMSHFANADSDDPRAPDSFTLRQLKVFEDAVAALRQAGAPLAMRHIANSSGAMQFPGARLDAVRVGLALYGNGAWTHEPAVARRQAMRLVTEVAQLRHVEVGVRVGYGGLWQATRPSVLAVLPVGYADGLARRGTGAAQVLIAGRTCPLVGAISMDIAIADVTDVPTIAVGDTAVLLGADGATQQISAARYGAWTGLTEYEVTCGMSKRVPRLHLPEESRRG